MAEHVAAAPVDQADGVSVRAAQGLERDGVAPLGGVGAGADDGDGGGVEQGAEVPAHRWVAGLLSERERLQALEAATIVVVPSPYESLSLLALEAMAVGTPVLCNARAAVLVEHCMKSNAGLFYADR